MAKHYYEIEFVSPVFLEEDEIQELEELIANKVGAKRVTTEYVDSEG